MNALVTSEQIGYTGYIERGQIISEILNSSLSSFWSTQLSKFVNCTYYHFVHISLVCRAQATHFMYETGVYASTAVSGWWALPSCSFALLYCIVNKLCFKPRNDADKDDDETEHRGVSSHSTLVTTVLQPDITLGQFKRSLKTLMFG